MSDYGDGDEDEYGEWMYVEDYWDEANELAEHTCPSPAPYFDLVPDDYDMHDYWQDIEYISDGGYYEDHREPRHKRKVDAKPSQRPNKRRRQVEAANQKTLGPDPISWMTQDQREKMQHHAPLITSGHTRSFALLKDWDQRFKDAPGLISTPKLDLDTEDPGHTVSGDGFDLGDLQSVAGLLSEDTIGTLQEILKAKGLDPEAVQAVLQDLIAGKEPAFEDGEEEEQYESEGHPDEEMPGPAAEQTEDVPAAASGDFRFGETSTEAGNPPTSTSSDQQPQILNSQPQSTSSTRRSKRKGRVDDGSNDLSDGAPTTRRKRLRAKRYENESDEGSLNPSLHVANGSAQPGETSSAARASRLTPEVQQDDMPRTRSGRARRR